MAAENNHDQNRRQPRKSGPKKNHRMSKTRGKVVNDNKENVRSPLQGVKDLKCEPSVTKKASYRDVLTRGFGKHSDGRNLPETTDRLVIEGASLESRKNEVEKAPPPQVKKLQEPRESESSMENKLEQTRKKTETLSNVFQYQNCNCNLSCPHPLAMNKEGLIEGGPCGCAKEKPCLCVTHSITMEMSIKGGPSGPIKIDLAGRTNPHAVNRLLRAAKENHFAGLIIDHVKKDSFMDGGYFGKDGEPRALSLNPREKNRDACDKGLIKGKRFSVGLIEARNLGRTTFRIQMGDKTYDKYFRTVGEVVEGFELLNDINKMPVVVTDSVSYLPHKWVTIVKSTGHIGIGHLGLKNPHEKRG